MNDSINDITAELNEEPKAVHIDDDFEQSSGAWPKGWYSAAVLEGYSTPKGTQFITSEAASKDGSSRNLRLCFAVTNGAQTRNIQETFNYRVSDFSPERMSMIKELRKEYKEVKGAWPDKDAQRTNLALVSFKALQSALGHDIQFSTEGLIVPAQFVGIKVQVHLVVDDNGYNRVNTIRPPTT